MLLQSMSFLASYCVLVCENNEESLLDFADYHSLHSLFGQYRLNVFNNCRAGSHNVDCCEQKTVLSHFISRTEGILAYTCFAVMERIPLETVLAKQVSGVLWSVRDVRLSLQSRNADCKKGPCSAKYILWRRKQELGETVSAPDTCCFLLC